MASRFVSSIFKGGEVSDFWILMHQLGKNIIGEFVTPKTLDLDDLKFEDHAKGIKCCCQEESEQLYVFYSRFSPTNQHMIRQLILDRLNKKIKNTSVFSSLWMFMVNTKITYHTKLGVVSNINFLPARHLSMINVSAPRMMLKAILACMDMIWWETIFIYCPFRNRFSSFIIW